MTQRHSAALTGKVAVVTGGSRGLGRAICAALAAAGAQVVTCGRNAPADLPEGVAFATLDVRDAEAVEAFIVDVAARHGRIDILVNNAGISQRSLAVDSDTAVYDAVIGTDLIAPIHLTQHCLPHLIKNGTGQIVAISSIAGRCGVPLRTADQGHAETGIGFTCAINAARAASDASSKAALISRATSGSRTRRSVPSSARSATDRSMSWTTRYRSMMVM